MKASVDDFLRAATPDSTRRSYQNAVDHFELDFGGFLPTTSDSVARYLSTYAGKLSTNTLRQRLSALAQWHSSQGFPDPTKAPLISKVMRGIRRVYPPSLKQAKPLAIQELEVIDNWLSKQIANAREVQDDVMERRATRDRAIILIGFWRGFRSDELSRLRIENIETSARGLIIHLAHTKTMENGITFKAPLLSRLCPTRAYQDWLNLCGCTYGPVFRSVNRWGHISDCPMNATSYIKLIRRLFNSAGIAKAQEYSSHSLRRGFATWASSSGWSLKELMEYVGWQDIGSALRYIDAPDPFGQLRIERQLSSIDNVKL